MSNNISYVKDNINNNINILTSEEIYFSFASLKPNFKYNSNHIKTYVKNSTRNKVLLNPICMYVQNICDYNITSNESKELFIKGEIQKNNSLLVKSKDNIDACFYNNIYESNSLIFDPYFTIINSNESLHHVKYNRSKIIWSYALPVVNIMIDKISSKQYNFDACSINVNIGEKTRINDSITPISTNVYQVSNIKPEIISSGNGLKHLNLELQLMSFYKIDLTFTEKTVKDVIGLPQGLIFYEKEKCIKGSAVKAGEYNITITLNDNSVIKGLFNIPILKRNQ